jgi:predicted negative regulator of RcsB-dependent stress response
VESYRTEEEQVEALRRWWNENGRSTIAAVILALGVGFGWQGWKQYDQGQQEQASALYQGMLQAMGTADSSAAQKAQAIELAEQLKLDYSGSSYAQFAALLMARIAVVGNDLPEAEAQLRWVLGKADKGSDIAFIAQLRLARVLAASGDVDQALTILDQAGEGPYKASYALARGDILLGLGREDEARQAYSAAQMLAGVDGSQVDLALLEQKLQALNPVPVRALDSSVEQED